MTVIFASSKIPRRGFQQTSETRDTPRKVLLIPIPYAHWVEPQPADVQVLGVVAEETGIRIA
jgi:hypothetical protein